MWNDPLLDAFFTLAQATSESPLVDLPAAAWAFIGVVVTAIAAWVRERMKARSSPYADMAERLGEIEDRASRVPSLEAQLWLLHTWGESIIEWAESIHEQCEANGIHVPPPPQPPPIFDSMDRRGVDFGPLYGGSRRADGGPSS